MDDTDAPAHVRRASAAIGQTLGDVPLQVAASYLLGTACVDVGDYRRAEDLLGEVVQSLDGDLTRERCGLYGFPAVMSRAFLTRALAERGAFATVSCTDRRRSASPRRSVTPPALGHAFWLLGYLHGLKGDFSQAVRLLERGLAVSREAHILSLTVHNGGGPGSCPRAVGACGGGPRPAALGRGGSPTLWDGHISVEVSRGPRRGVPRSPADWTMRGSRASGPWR